MSFKRAFYAARAAFSENYRRRQCVLDGVHAVDLSLIDNGVPYFSRQYSVLREAVVRCTRPGVQRIIDNLESAKAQAEDEFWVWVNEHSAEEI